MENGTSIPADTPAAPIAPATPIEQPKVSKKKPLLIVGIIIAVLLVIGGGVGAFAFFSWKNSPEAIALDAFSNLIKAPNKTVDGTLSISASRMMEIDYLYDEYDEGENDDDEYDDDDDVDLITNCIGATKDTNCVVYEPAPYLESAEVKLRGSSNSGANMELNTNVSTKMSNSDSSDFSANLIYTSNGLIYFKSEDLAKTINFAPLSTIDGQWWKISVSDIADSMRSYIGDFASLIKDAYSCSTTMINDSIKNTNAIADLYSKNQFAKLKEQSKNSYSLELDAEKLANFLNGINNLDYAKNYGSCVSKISEKYNAENTIEIKTVTTEDVKEKIIDKIPSSMRFELDGGRNITKISFGDMSMSTYNVKAEFSLGYPSTVDISAPDKSNSMTDLIKSSIMGFFSPLMSSGQTEVDYSLILPNMV